MNNKEELTSEQIERDAVNELLDMGFNFDCLDEIKKKAERNDLTFAEYAEGIKRLFWKGVSVEDIARESLGITSEPEAMPVILPQSAAEQMKAFNEYVKASAKHQFISTGFKALDKVLDGGLYTGLYALGAVSSLGKTTFALNITDNIARQGRDVIIFSLEMSRYELMAKSISRETLLLGSPESAKTIRGVLNYNLYDSYSGREIEVIDKAEQNYSEYAKHIYIVEGVGNIGVEQIREQVRAHIEHYHSRPVIMIDYLQILAPANERATDKQNADRNILELKRLSRDFDIPVLIISSFNRENYSEEVNLSSFKESGGIEYGCDVVMGMQYNVEWEKLEGEKNKAQRRKALRNAKAAEPRNIELKVLKQRNGVGYGEVFLKYYPRFNVYFDDESYEEYQNSNPFEI